MGRCRKSGSGENGKRQGHEGPACQQPGGDTTGLGSAGRGGGGWWLWEGRWVRRPGWPRASPKRSPYFSESRAMSALSRVSFPGPDFTSPAGPAGSKLSGAWAAALCGLSSSESGGPAALQGGGARERQSGGEPRKPPSMRRPMKTDFVSWAPKHAALVREGEPPPPRELGSASVLATGHPRAPGPAHVCFCVRAPG